MQDWVFSSEWPRKYDAVIAKFDHQTPRNQSLVRINRGTAHLVYPHQFDGIATPARNVIDRPFFGVALNDTWSISPHSILDVRLGLQAAASADRPWSEGFNLASLGFPASFVKQVKARPFQPSWLPTSKASAGSPEDRAER